jgi:hypothetical protein
MRQVADTGNLRTKLMGGAAGLILGLLLGGILIPLPLITAPLTAFAGAAAAALTEHTLSESRRATMLPLEGALIGCASGLACGAVAGMVGGLLYGLFLLMVGGAFSAAIGALYFAFETSAITGLVGLFCGFLLGVYAARE